MIFQDEKEKQNRKKFITLFALCNEIISSCFTSAELLSPSKMSHNRNYKQQLCTALVHMNKKRIKSSYNIPLFTLFKTNLSFFAAQAQRKLFFFSSSSSFVLFILMSKLSTHKVFIFYYVPRVFSSVCCHALHIWINIVFSHLRHQNISKSK